MERLDADPDGVGRHRVAPPRPRAGHSLDARLVVVDREVVGRRLPATSNDQNTVALAVKFRISEC